MKIKSCHARLRRFPQSAGAALFSLEFRDFVIAAFDFIDRGHAWGFWSSRHWCGRAAWFPWLVIARFLETFFAFWRAKLKGLDEITHSGKIALRAVNLLTKRA